MMKACPCEDEENRDRSQAPGLNDAEAYSTIMNAG